MKTAEIVIVGTGSLAAGVANALSQIAEKRLRVAVIGRSMGKARRLTAIANARAGIFGTSAVFEPIELAKIDEQSFSKASRELKPKVIFQAASMQSPWEASAGQNAWTKLVESAGFGITLPLQMALAAEISRGAGNSKAAIVNASYPDCVNVCLHRLGLRITCGIGNSSIVEGFCRSVVKGQKKDVRVVGHHGHLSAWLKGNAGVSHPRLWVGAREMDALRFRPDLGPLGEDLNAVTSATAVSVIMALFSGKTLKLSIPGVRDLPGGYPYVVRKGKFSLRLPRGITREQAIAHNQTGERLDGLELRSGVRFVEKAHEALAAVGFEYAQGFELEEWEAVRDCMLALRERLRATTV